MAIFAIGSVQSGVECCDLGCTDTGTCIGYDTYWIHGYAISRKTPIHGYGYKFFNRNKNIQQLAVL